jgi:hypothetical protein
MNEQHEVDQLEMHPAIDTFFQEEKPALKPRLA